MSELLDSYKDFEHGSPCLSSPNVKTVWWEVRKDNEKDCSASGKRFTVFRNAVVDHTEKNESTSHPAAFWTALDVRGLQIWVFLKLEKGELHELAIILAGSPIMAQSKRNEKANSLHRLRG